MKIAIVGSRNFYDFDKLEKFIFSKVALEKIELVVSGGAIGADSLAERFAYKHKLPKQVFKPDWNKYSKSAGFTRNKLIIENVDTVFAFWDGSSKGTKLSIDLAKEKNKLLYLLIF